MAVTVHMTRCLMHAWQPFAYQVAHHIGMIAFLQHCNLLLYLRHLILIAQGDDLDSYDFTSLLDMGFVYRPI